MKPKYKDLFMVSLLAISVVLFLIIAALGRSRLSDKSREMVDLKLQSRTADDQLSSLAATKKQVQKYSYFNDVAKTVIPNDKDQAQAVLDVFQMASAAGIALQNIDFPASNLGLHSSSSSSSSSSPGAISQAKPVSGISGLYSLQLTITPLTGAGVPASQLSTYPKFLNFLSRIERDRRTAQITQVNIEPQTSSSSLGFTLTVNIFIKP